MFKRSKSVGIEKVRWHILFHSQIRVYHIYKLEHLVCEEISRKWGWGRRRRTLSRLKFLRDGSKNWPTRRTFSSRSQSRKVVKITRWKRRVFFKVRVKCCFKDGWPPWPPWLPWLPWLPWPSGHPDHHDHHAHHDHPDLVTLTKIEC